METYISFQIVIQKLNKFYKEECRFEQKKTQQTLKTFGCFRTLTTIRTRGQSGGQFTGNASMKIETYGDINALLLGKQHGKELDKMHMLNTVKEKTGKVFQCDQGHL